MAAIWITDAQRYIGTAADKAALATGSVKAGATFLETDTRVTYIWNGSSWTLR